MTWATRPRPTSATAAGLDESLRAIHVRVWAELGRAGCRSASSSATPAGAVVELDRQADEPVDLFVNGMRFASAGSSSPRAASGPSGSSVVGDIGTGERRDALKARTARSIT